MMYGLNEKEIHIISSVFAAYPAIEKVIVFGSRAMGNYQPYSDIDLAYVGALAPEEERRLYHMLEDLPLPYQFDIQSYAAITHAPLREHIDRVGKLFYRRT